MSIEKKMLAAENTSWLTEDFTKEELFEDAILAEIAMAIQDYRRTHGLSQMDLAKKVGVSQTIISRWESADENLTLGSIAKIAAAIGATLQCPIIYSKAG